MILSGPNAVVKRLRSVSGWVKRASPSVLFSDATRFQSRVDVSADERLHDGDVTAQTHASVINSMVQRGSRSINPVVKLPG